MDNNSMDISMDHADQNYVNFNIRQQQRASSVGDLSDSSKDYHNISLPLTDVDSNSDTSEKCRIIALESQLLSSHEQVDSLLLENSELKKQIEKDRKIIRMYKNIDFGEIQGSPLCGRRKRMRPSMSRGFSPAVRDTELERQQFISERHQETIEKLNLEITKLKTWIQEEKEKNDNTKKDKKEVNKSIKKHVKILAKLSQGSHRTIQKKIKNLNRKIRMLEKQCLKEKQENKKLQHQVQELLIKESYYFTKNNDSATQENEQNTVSKEDNKKNTSSNKRIIIKKTTILSDSIGKGIAANVLNKLDDNNIIKNYCQPGANFYKILENFNHRTKDLNDGDTTAILITNYRDAFYSTRILDYIKILKEIFDSKERKFNIIISGIRYNFRNDDEIYKINKTLAHLANSADKVKYLDPNMTNSDGKLCSYKVYRKSAEETLILALTNKRFQGSSALKFIECQPSNDLVTDSTKNNSNFQDKIQFLTNT